VNEEIRRVNIDFPAWVIFSLDRDARSLGVTQQSLVKMWIAENVDQVNEAAKLPYTLSSRCMHFALISVLSSHQTSAF